MTPPTNLDPTLVRPAADVAGVCARPIVSRVTENDTGESRLVPIACGSTREDRCAPCADRAKRLRIQQRREGWHLDTEPEHDDPTPDEDDRDDGGQDDDPDDTDRRVRSTRRRQDAPEPRVPMEDRTVGRVFTAPDGRAYRPSEVCFRGLLIRLVTGSSWVDIEAILGFAVSDTTLRARRDEWIAAGVFDALATEALTAYDRILELDLDVVALDGSIHKAPCGGEGICKSPVDRGKLGWKWSVAADRAGIPIGWAIDGANRNDIRLLEPTLDAVAATGLLDDIGTLSRHRTAR